MAASKRNVDLIAEINEIIHVFLEKKIVQLVIVKVERKEDQSQDLHKSASTK